MVCGPLPKTLNTCCPCSPIKVFCFDWRFAITAELFRKGLCLWPPENRSVTPKGGRGPRLKNPGLDKPHDAITWYKNNFPSADLWPHAAAVCKGVAPSLSAELISSPELKRTMMIKQCIKQLMIKRTSYVRLKRSNISSLQETKLLSRLLHYTFIADNTTMALNKLLMF